MKTLPDRRNTLHPCDCGCGKLIEHLPGHGKWYATNACRQRAYRNRKRGSSPRPYQLKKEHLTDDYR